ncbi:hypothetical protein OMO38_06580 [Chryseobacterium sp. 09-1422]|uniref:Uncharacterized protein n=1 Tax=Chryseobacterium kimseyorum TaxID=2984028 RepID=A0ABT3HWK7_9FLAO|nr:hypothetical protein [Chryseobacterium kimseyorum]MCW3168187.1 hypothetical protein [Chryseobacterium kimseyorum]
MNSITFDQAFQTYILNRKVIAWGFQHEVKVLLPNGYYAYPSGYFTEYENGYKMIASGATLHKTQIQEVMILDPDGVPIARDTEDTIPCDY